MEPLHFSFVIPVYNRPDEIEELLDSFTKLNGNSNFEIIIVEDGSLLDCKKVVETYQSQLNLSYYFKQNSGPGDSRNYGMQRAKGNYFIILDSDCLLPESYLEAVEQSLKLNFVDCFGGPDAAHESFSSLQKAINFAMTSFMTTGGIRGGKSGQKNFQPRSFNMGISKQAFEVSSGFGTIHPGEDPDLAIRLEKLGFKTALFSDAFVYHKRRMSWSKFYQQVYKFGLVRPILNQWHPETDRPVYWFPTLFSFGFIVAISLLLIKFKWLIMLYAFYFIAVFLAALATTKNFLVAIQSIMAILIQFFGYGYGFLKSTLKLKFSEKSPEHHFPKLFFRHAK
ncbi:MAG: glycosyltransferase [Gelidibacter sp.]